MNEITSKNTVLVTTSLFDNNNNSISAKRRENLKNIMSKYNIPIFLR